MRLLVLALVLGLVPALPLAQAKGPMPPPEAGPGTATFVGTVTDDAGQPWAGARVSLHPAVDPEFYRPYALTTADTQGRYQMAGPSGEFRIVATHADGLPAARPVSAAAGATVETLLQVVRIPEPSMPIHGRIVSSSGAASPHAMLTIDQPSWGRSVCAVTKALADLWQREGNPTDCKAAIQPDGTFEMLARPGLAVATAEEVAPSCGPTASCFLHARWVATVQVTGPLRLDATLLDRTPAATLRVRVVDPAGQPVEGATVHIAGHAAGDQGQTGPDGSYRAADHTFAGGNAPPRVAPGRYEVLVQKEGHFDWTATVDVQPGENSVDAVLAPGQPPSQVWHLFAERWGASGQDPSQSAESVEAEAREQGGSARLPHPAAAVVLALAFALLARRPPHIP